MWLPTLLNYCKRKFLKKIHLYVLLLIPPTLVILYKNIIECKNIFCFNKKLWIEPGMFHIINLKLLLLHNNSFFLYPTFLCKKTLYLQKNDKNYSGLYYYLLKHCTAKATCFSSHTCLIFVKLFRLLYGQNVFFLWYKLCFKKRFEWNKKTTYTRKLYDSRMYGFFLSSSLSWQIRNFNVSPLFVWCVPSLLQFIKNHF